MNSNRNVMVTGGNKGIGAAIVKKLSEAGYTVIATFNLKEPDKPFQNVIYKKLDIRNGAACKVLLTELTKDKLFPSILINNAGITKDQMFHKMTEEQWKDVLATNLFALFNITQPIYSEMRANSFGRILNISSVNALKGQMGQVNYCASKAGIIGFTKALALEGASFGVTVNTISPGYTATDMVATIALDIRKKIESSIPLGRFSRPEEIASFVKYLISDDASYISGANLNINGALHLA